MYDEVEQIVELATGDERMPAWMIKERLGSRLSVRRIQEIVHDYVGPRPLKPKVDSLRSRVIAHMVNVNDLHPHVCYLCGKFNGGDMYIRALRRDDSLDSLVFVGKCHRRAGDL